MRETNLQCPRCGAVMHKAIAWSGAESEFWYVCSRAPQCNTYFNSMRPMSHQSSVLADGHKLILNAGGYGSAKTYVTRQFIYKQAFLNPGGSVLVGANVSSQYEQTIKKELEADIPAAFVRTYSAQKQYMELYNGARILYRPFDDPNKIRSMNLSAWVIMEGSEVDPEVFTQLKSRLRNMCAANFAGYDENGVPKYVNFRGQGLVESNPEQGWLREDMLKPADAIYQHGTAAVKYKPDESKRDPSISVHISSSDSNVYLPDNYITDLCKNKPQWWVDRYVFGSFEFANGLVYPDWKDCVIPSFIPDDKWVRLIAHDPGLVDPSAFVCVAVDDKQGMVYVYRDKQYKDMGVDELYEHWTKDIVYDISMSQLYTQPIMDPKMHGRRMFTDKNSLDQMWADKGVYFQPGHIKVEDRVWRMLTYMKAGRLKIMDNCLHLLEELPEYKWVVSKDGTYRQKPVDKNNHSIDALSWTLMKLPEDPGKLTLGAYTNFGMLETKHKTEEERLSNWMFEDDVDADDAVDNMWSS